MRLQDEFGTPVEGAADAVVVSVSGANASSALTVTDKGGRLLLQRRIRRNTPGTMTSRSR